LTYEFGTLKSVLCVQLLPESGEVYIEPLDCSAATNLVPSAEEATAVHILEGAPVGSQS
jgi:hypothetical protein